MASNPSFPPDKILKEAASTLVQHGSDYDVRGYQGGERSMARTVELFAAMTGVQMTEIDGWRFMICLKLARSTSGKPKLDNYVDLAGYAALLGECHLASRAEMSNEKPSPEAP